MRTRKRIFIGAVLILCAAVWLAGCAGPNPEPAEPTLTEPLVTAAAPTEPPPSPTPTTEPLTEGTLTIWHTWDETEIPVLVEIVEAFQEIYPDILFDVLYVPINDLPARFAAEAQQGFGPVLVLGPAEWGPAFFEQGLLADLTDRAPASLIESLNQPAVASGEYNGTLIGLPYTIQGVVLYRNMNLVFEVPESFPDLVTLAQPATGGEVVGAYLERSFLYAGAHLNGLGGQLMLPDGTPAFNDEHGLAWVELLRNFALPGPAAFQSDQDLELFMQGNAGMIIDGTWNRQAIAEAVGISGLAIDPWPVYEDGSLSGYVQSENIYMNAQAHPGEQDLAWEFIQFFLSQASQTRLAETGRIPANLQVVLEDPTTDPLLPQAMAALAGGTPYPTHPSIEIYATALDAALRSVFDQGMSAEDALQRAEDTIYAALEGVTPTPPQ